jgi:hypothetical protein
MGISLPPPVHPGTSGRAPSPQRRTTGETTIGAPLEEARRRLLGLAFELERHLGEHAQPLLLEARKQLQQRTCRIAVIGQVKAGKSTFINAMTQRPGLLPTDINPWTAVVTSLHFRRSATPPEHAAVFQLFSGDEWHNLAEGGGRLRELTERLVPEFHPELLRAQLEVMRKRAERRLGKSFQALLGKCHRHKEITPQLLTDYISAGDDFEDAQASRNARKRYSDITRTAELFFSDGPFSFPVTLIDTPGTNDPFLVRDEITRRSLENPDIYVFVISALQPLSAADISMLRLLNGLHKERSSVFINRADQLPNPTTDAVAIRRIVEQRLHLEFPALDIPVITGSAWLGNLSLEPQRADLRGGLKGGQLAALWEAGLPRSIDATAEKLPAADQSRVAAALHTSSGIRAVSHAINRLMATSNIAVLYRQIGVCFLELVRSADISAKAELKSADDLLRTRRKEAQALNERIAEERQSLAHFEQRAGALQTTFAEIKCHLDQVIAGGLEFMGSELRQIVRQFADEQAEELLLAAESRTEKTWVCNVMPLRAQVETAYIASFDRTVADLVRIEEFLYPQLKVIVSRLLPGYSGTVLEAPGAPAQTYPAMSSLSDTLAMDLSMPWWKLWGGTRRTPHERADHLQDLIEDEFLTIVDQLMTEARAQLEQRVAHTMQRANAISGGLLAGIEQRSAHLKAQCQLLEGSGDEESLRQFVVEQEKRASSSIERQTACAVFIEEIEGVVRALDAGKLGGNARGQ